MNMPGRNIVQIFAQTKAPLGLRVQTGAQFWMFFENKMIADMTLPAPLPYHPETSERELPLWRLAGIVLIFSAHGAMAQTRADAGSILRNIEKSTLQPAPQAKPQVEQSGGEAPMSDSGLRVRVRGFSISGATLIDETELRALLTDNLEKELSLSQLQAVTLRIGEYYRTKGYFARALLPQQAIEDGVIEIQVLEGRLGGVNVSPQSVLQRLDPEVARQFVLSQQGTGAPLRPEALQKGMRILNELPGVQAIGGLLSGKTLGDSNFFIKIDEGPLLESQVILDNAGSVSTGKERLVANLAINDPSGQGDQVNLLALATDGTQYVSAAYQRPISTRGLMGGINASSLRYQIGGLMTALGANGTAEKLALTLAYPLQRSITLDLDIHAGASSKYMLNNVLGQNTSKKKVQSYSLGVSGSQRDGIGGGGQNQFEVKLFAGDLVLADNVQDAANDLAGARSQGSFGRLAFSTSRLQRVNQSTGLLVSLNGQFANHNLDSSEQFSLGGPNGVRAFATSEASGDEGWLLTTEFRYQYSEVLQIQAFLDTGEVNLHRNLWPGWDSGRPGQPNRYALGGAGFGVTCKLPMNFVLKAALAWRLGNNPGTADNRDSDGSNEQPRAWLQISKTL